MEEQMRPNPEQQNAPTIPPLPETNPSNATAYDAPLVSAVPPIASPAPEEFNEADARVVAVQALREKAASSVGVMYLIMAFSVLNMALIAFGSPFVMAFGLSVTDVISALSKKYGYVHLLWNLIPLGFYFLLTTQARKKWGWLAFLMVVYGIDAFLAFVDQDWFGVAVHAYVLYLFWQGVSAYFAAGKLEKMPSDYVG